MFVPSNPESSSGNYGLARNPSALDALRVLIAKDTPMKPTSIAMGVIAISFATGSAHTQTISPADQSFATRTAEAIETDSAMGHLATEKAATNQVQGFASLMIQFRDEAKHELADIAQQQHLTLPDHPNAENQAAVEHMQTLHGQAFDNAYVETMIRAQRQNVADVRDEIQNGQNPELKAFAQKYLPILEQHLAVAQDINTR
jgi:putative membrane protein